MSKSPVNSIGAIFVTIIVVASLPFIIGVGQILIAIVMVPIMLYIWSLVGATLGMGLFGLVSPSYGNKLVKTMDIDFPDCMKSSGYWITLIASIAYVAFAVAMCGGDNIHKASGDEKFLWLLKCGFFFVLPFIGMWRMSRADD